MHNRRAFLPTTSDTADGAARLPGSPCLYIQPDSTAAVVGAVLRRAAPFGFARVPFARSAERPSRRRPSAPSGDGGVRRTECLNTSGGLHRIFAKTHRSANRRHCKTTVSADFGFCKILKFCKWETPIYDSSSHGHPLCFPTPASVLNFIYAFCPRISPLLISN